MKDFTKLLLEGNNDVLINALSDCTIVPKQHINGVVKFLTKLTAGYDPQFSIWADKIDAKGAAAIADIDHTKMSRGGGYILTNGKDVYCAYADPSSAGLDVITVYEINGSNAKECDMDDENFAEELAKKISGWTIYAVKTPRYTTFISGQKGKINFNTKAIFTQNYERKYHKA